MKKTIPVLCCLVLLLATTITFTQQFRVIFDHTFGGEGNDSIRCIQPTRDGGWIATGITTSRSGNLTGNYGGEDIWVIKLNSQGKIEWQRNYGGRRHDRGYWIEQTSDGGYILAAATSSNEYDISGNHGTWDIWIAKLDPSGEIQWSRCYGGSQGDSPRKITEDNAGGYIFTGYTFSNNHDVSNHKGGKDFWVVRLDRQGTILWERTLGGSRYDQPYDIVQLRDQSYAVVGYTFSNNGDVSDHYGNGDYWVAKLDRQGNIQWEQNYGGRGWDEPRSMVATMDGGFVIAGGSSSPDGDVSKPKGNQDFWIVKIDRNGTLLWERSYGGSRFDKAYSITETRDGGFVVVGITESNDGDVRTHHGGRDIWVLRLSRTGTLLRQHTIGTTADEGAEMVVMNADGTFTLAGGEYSVSGGEVAGEDGRRYKDFRIIHFGF